MDRDWGSKSGGGGVSSSQHSNIDRRERLRQLALETIDITKVNFISPLMLSAVLKIHNSMKYEYCF